MAPKELDADERVTVDAEHPAWRPAEPDEHCYLACVEYAKSGRAKCRRCSSKISKGVARVGFPIPERRGEFGIISAWQHPECSRVSSEQSQTSLKQKLHGIETLSEIDQEKVLNELSKAEAAPLDEIRPEDEEFFKRKTDVQPMEAPDSLTRALLPFQKEGLSWLVQQEQSEYAGGILADEMGMGKTIQMVAMLVKRKEMAMQAMRDGDDANAHGVGPTLIVCPTSAMPQWADEICSFTQENYLSVATYYGDRKSFSARMLQSYDVVVTTYPVVEREWRSVAESLKVSCKYCGKKYMPRALVVHNQYFCGPDAARSEKLLYKEKKRGAGGKESNGEQAHSPSDAAHAPKRNVQKAETMQKGMRTLGIGNQEDRQEMKKRQDHQVHDDAVEGNGASVNSRKRSVPTPMAVYNEMMEEAGRQPKAMGERGSKREAKEGDEAAGNAAQSRKDPHSVEEKCGSDLVGSADNPIVMEETEHSDRDAAVGSEQPAPSTSNKSAGAKKQASSSKAQAQNSGNACKGQKRKRAKTGGHEAEELKEVNEQQQGKQAPKNGQISQRDWQLDDAEDAPRRKTRSSTSHDKCEHHQRPIQEQPVENSESKDGKETLNADTDEDSDEDFKLENENEHAQADTDDENEIDHEDDEHVEEKDEGLKQRGGKGKGAKTKAKQQMGNESNASNKLAAKPNKSETESQLHQQTTTSITQKLSDNAGTTAGELDEDTLASDQDLDMSQSVLHAVRWSRIILDEAHKIKSRTTNSAKSIYALRGTFKWCITGTPLQNRVGELFSLIRFLKLDPFAYYFCKNKNCNCKSLNWNFGPMARRCIKCGHPPMQHYSCFNQFIMNPINRYGYVGDGKQAMITLKQDIMDKLQLRRTKQERERDMSLPPLDIDVKKIQLSEEERDFYESIYKLSSSKFDTFVQKGTVLHNYAHIFELLARLRQAVDHPFLILQRDDEVDQVSAPAKREEPAYYCGICQEEVDVESIAVSGCNHTFHRTCIMEYTTMVMEQATCPVCKVALSIDMQPQDLSNVPTHVQQQQQREKQEDLLGSAKKGILSRLNMDKYQPSAKIEALVKCLQQMREEHSENKAIVFSQYTNMIDLTEWRLKKAGIDCVKLLGSMPLKQRRAVLQSFRSNPSVSCILLSLKAGGEGLNLQAASHVMVLEPWWNPAVESQAIQRAHRIGQTKKVKALRFCVQDTIEEKMLQLQEKKQLAFDGCVDGSVTSLAQLTSDDLGFLFKR